MTKEQLLAEQQALLAEKEKCEALLERLRGALMFCDRLLALMVTSASSVTEEAVERDERESEKVG